MGSLSRRLPDFPWDQLAEASARAAAHPDGLVDLSVGTPVDPTPDVIQTALAAATDAPGYPTSWGAESTRAAVVDWLHRRAGVVGIDPANVALSVGSKELIAALPLHLGIGAGELIVIPELAYPTYEVGAALVGARVLAGDSLTAIGPERPALLWLNSPSNPSGRVLGLEHLRKVVQWCREREVLLVSDECYLECWWEGEPPRSILDPEVCEGDPTGLLTVHSLSKRSNLAGYRGAFVAGDAQVVAELVAVRKNLGLIVPAPIQAAMIAALGDDAHVAVQRETYAARRQALKGALESAGFRIDHSTGALYLWATRDEDCDATVSWLAERGILVAPGRFYGAAGARHVRVALTATDERVAAAVRRLS